MTIYSNNGDKLSSVEILLNSEELRILLSALKDFEIRCEKYISEHKEEKDRGMAHVHYQDYDKTCKGICDLVFYVDLDREG